MTSQSKHAAVYCDESYAIVGIDGSALFDPAQQGIEAGFGHTACPHGFVCEYAVSDGLFLSQIHIALNQADRADVGRGKGPMLFGRLAHTYIVHGIQGNGHGGFTEYSGESHEVIYDGLHELIPFTGGLLIGRDHIREIFTSWTWLAHTFRTVHELIFHAGRLIEEYDRSDEMAQFRAMLAHPSLQPGKAASEEHVKHWVKKWLERHLLRDYDKFGDFTIEILMSRDDDDSRYTI